MAIPALKLNLAPPSTFWRSNHQAISWAALALGALVLAGTAGFTLQAYRSAATSARRVGALNAQIQTTTDAQTRILDDLRNIDVARELPRWRLAERIFTERSLPWSRLTAELERSMVEGVRITSLQRYRGSDLKVQLKLSGEAHTRAAEAAFVTALHKNPFFEQVILEREGELQGGGVAFNYTLAAVTTPQPYHPLPSPQFASAHPVGSMHPSQELHPAALPAAMARPANPMPAGRPAPAYHGGVAVPDPAPPPNRAQGPRSLRDLRDPRDPTGMLPHHPSVPRTQPGQPEEAP